MRPVPTPMKLTLLGTGTSVGVPMIGCHCETCTSADPRDHRLRTGLLVEHAEHRILVDISADFRQQALRHNITKLDALLITHCHADHVFGLDDIRPINFKYGVVPLYASARTWRDLRRVFYYVFERTYPGGGLPQLSQHEFEGPFETCGLAITPIPVIHGKGEVTAFRFNVNGKAAAFVTDCNEISPASLDQLRGLEVLIIDALGLKPHPTHLHLEQTLAYIADVKPRRALLTHMGHQIKYAEWSTRLPEGVELAYDGLQVAL